MRKTNTIKLLENIIKHSRVTILIITFFHCLIIYCIGIKSWVTVSFLFLTYALYLYLFYIDFKKILIRLHKFRNILRIAYGILAAIYFNWIMIISSQQAIINTSYPISAFSTAETPLFILITLIFLLPITSTFFLFLSVCYELKGFCFIDRSMNLHSIFTLNFAKKFTYYLITMIIPFALFVIIFNNSSFFSYSGGSLYNRLLVYSSFTDISPKCLNKQEIENKYKIDNLQAAVVNNDLVIAIPYNGSYYFEGEKCLRKTDEK
ncbi:hypothetical protein KRX11_01140 [Pasteurellaceae bacterium TAE3-ERU1]|nr:hypothetical protein [Pasteurellaceae bacterium TAE3-ERU1]